MPVRVFPPQNHSDHRIQLLKDIKKFKAGNGSNPLLSSAVESLLNSMVSYLEHDNSQDEDFDDVDDEDFLLVETADTSLDTSRLDLKRSSDFDDEPPSEKVKDGDEPPSKKVKVDDEPPSKKVNVEMAPVATSVARKILRGTWGFPGFKLLQEAAITRLISGCSAAVVFPTGGGKSLVYQVPALAFDDYDELCNRTRGGGVTLVVSPLIALMKDQVDALKKKGVAAAALDSSQTRESWLQTCDKLRRDELKLLYVAPERLNNEGFVEMISATKIRLIAVDEAHCISEWGHAFRPDYLKGENPIAVSFKFTNWCLTAVARFAKEIRAERVLCLTATAAPKVADDICAAFDIDKGGVFRTTTYRPNLRLLAQSFTCGAEKESALKRFLGEHKGPSIVYVQTHEQTDTVCAMLKQAGFNAYGYHAGMTNDARTAVQDKFMSSDNIVIVATIAFGMGIDKANIRNIVHYTVPKSLEGYSQEIGRAGRDGLESTCMIYLYAGDIRIMEEWSRADVPSSRSVKGLVGKFLEMHRYKQPGDVIERNLNEESREWDIRRNALDLLNAQLELRFELIRAVTPKYTEHKFTKSPSFDRQTTDGSAISATLKRLSKTAKTWTHIDVEAAAQSGGFSRAEAVRRLQEWSDCGAIDLRPSGVVNRFRILNNFPESEKARDEIISAIYAQIEAKEKDDMDRVQSVISFITAKSCLSRQLARHFGDEGSIPQSGCGHCNFCMTKEAVKFIQKGDYSRKGRIHEAKIKAVLAATASRDDARYLARVAFGISSPRVTIEKLGKHPAFGNSSDCDFEELVQRFQKVCG